MRALLYAVLVTTLWTGLSRPLRAGHYNAIDDQGVRVFSAVPDVGVHPRVLMSPEDLPGWRDSVINTYRGKTFFTTRYESPLINTLAQIDPATVGRDLLTAYPHTDPGSNHHLLFATLDVIYHEDQVKAQTVCRALANFARVILARSQYAPAWGEITMNIGDINGLGGIAAGLGHLWLRGGADFALSYDYLYPFRTTLDPRSKEAKAFWAEHPLGAEMPLLDPTHAGFRIKTGAHTDDWRFVPGAEGRSHIRLQRDAHTYDVHQSH